MWVIAGLAALALVLALLLHEQRQRDDTGLWPLQVRPLLTEREQDLYQRLAPLYPQYQVMVQVALSQLLQVRPEVAEARGIRNHFQQLSADFALCDAYFNVVAIIELDDSFHFRAARQYADARKDHALRSAGVRLIRVPAGPLPDAAQLRALIDGALEEVVLNDSRPPRTRPRDDGLQRLAMELLWKLGGAACVIGTFTLLYTQVLAPRLVATVQTVPQAATERARNAAAQWPQAGTTIRPPGSPGTNAATGTAQRAELQRQLEEQRARTALAQRKAAAWAAFYQAPAACDRPANWSEQVECGNRYIRAQREFEKQWAALQLGDPGMTR